MNKTKKVLSMVLALGFSASLAAPVLAGCGKDFSSSLTKEKGVYTYNTYTGTSPSNWNELTYKDNNDTQVMGYIGSSFFEYDFAFDANGEIIPGDFEVEYSAATALEDVTEDYAGNEKYAVPEDATKGYAYKITLRNDLKWDDGTPIDADDFVYTMKQQLDPLFKNYRADSFYNGATVIHNAMEYVYQGSEGWFDSTMFYSAYDPATLDDKLVFTLYSYEGGSPAFRAAFEFPDSYDAKKTAEYFKGTYFPDLDLDKVAEMEGKTLKDIKADADMKAQWDMIYSIWQGLVSPASELHFFVAEGQWPEVDFDDVGIFKGESEQELVVVLDQELVLLEDDGSLGYKAAYNFSSLPLVHQAKYEANKHEPVAGSDVWTSTYNSSVESTASWGPYKLTEFQAGKYYALERNEHWYGYNMDKYEGQFQTDKIRCDTITEWKSAWLKFKKGELDGIGIDVSIASEYKNSDQAYFTPDDYVGSLQLQSSRSGLEAREEAGVNKTMLLYEDFRKALSLSIDRDDFTAKTTTASKAGYGLFGIMHYHDVESGAEGLYRNSDYAKQVLCDVYGVDVSKYEDLDAAVDSITGYNLELARQLVDSAYDAALAAGDISATDKVVLTYGNAEDTDSTRRPYEYLKSNWVKLMKGTKLEGRFDLEFDGSFGDEWADQFRAGAYDICAGGWTGAAWDPGYMLMAYLSPDYVYATGWDTTTHMLEMTVHGVDAQGKATNNPEDSFSATLPLFTEEGNDWWSLLNGPWQAGVLDDEFRVELIAAIEGEILEQYWSVPYSTYYAASLQSFKTSYVTYDYNTFMGYGGMRYMTYNYDDYDWYKFVEKKSGKLNYK